MLKWRKNIIWVLAVVFLSIAGYALYVKAQGNFHPITPGEAYRSGQLDGDQLAHYVSLYNIKSILNLRGKHSGTDWYEEELAASVKLNLMHYDITLSATHELTGDEARQLVDIFKTAPRPILIHCAAGADRSGLAAAMWKVVVDGEPKAEAIKQLSILYGHIALSETHAMNDFFKKWKP